MTISIRVLAMLLAVGTLWASAGSQAFGKDVRPIIKVRQFGEPEEKATRRSGSFGRRERPAYIGAKLAYRQSEVRPFSIDRVIKRATRRSTWREPSR